jgi:hypothetical protein
MESRMFEASTSGAARFEVITVPLVIHVLWNLPDEDVSEAQIASQIAVLNEDFRAQNADLAMAPDAFRAVSADARLEFELATTAPDGSSHSGIDRVRTVRRSFPPDDSMKSSTTGGVDAWPTDRYLNIWVCELEPGGLGHAQLPGGPAPTDGVVIAHLAFGTTGTAAAPFDRGRTATHQVGHWLNLLHIWGDDGHGCNGTDFVEDTPNQAGPNYGRPSYPTVSCGNGPDGDMFVNYMDLVDDACMVMFTAGQVQRMRACIETARPWLLPDGT